MTTLNAGCVTWRIPIVFLMLFYWKDRRESANYRWR